MQTPTETAPECAPAMRVAQMAQGYMISSAISAVLRLQVAEILAEDELHLDVLSDKAGADKDALYRVLRLLTSLQIFVQSGDKVFANNEASNSLRGDRADSQRGFIEFISDPFHFQSYADMVPTIKTGTPSPELMTGKNVFDLFAADVDEQRRFDNAMTDLTKNVVPAVLEAYDFSSFKMLVDVAGGHGLLLSSILARNPQLQGVLFDQPHVAELAREKLASTSLSARCSTVGGDFFKSLPQSEAYIMKHVIHDWDDERALTILKNCRFAMSKTGVQKLLLIEMLLPDGKEPHPALFLDLEMLMLPGGRERTRAEYVSLLNDSGFRLNRVVPTKSPNSIIEAVPC